MLFIILALVSFVAYVLAARLHSMNAHISKELQVIGFPADIPCQILRRGVQVGVLCR